MDSASKLILIQTFEINWDGELKITEGEQKILKGDELISRKAGPGEWDHLSLIRNKT